MSTTKGRKTKTQEAGTDEEVAAWGTMTEHDLTAWHMNPAGADDGARSDPDGTPAAASPSAAEVGPIAAKTPGAADLAAASESSRPPTGPSSLSASGAMPPTVAHDEADAAAGRQPGAVDGQTPQTARPVPPVSQSGFDPSQVPEPAGPEKTGGGLPVRSPGTSARASVSTGTPGGSGRESAAAPGPARTPDADEVMPITGRPTPDGENPPAAPASPVSPFSPAEEASLVVPEPSAEDHLESDTAPGSHSANEAATGTASQPVEETPPAMEVETTVETRSGETSVSGPPATAERDGEPTGGRAKEPAAEQTAVEITPSPRARRTPGVSNAADDVTEAQTVSTEGSAASVRERPTGTTLPANVPPRPGAGRNPGSAPRSGQHLRVTSAAAAAAVLLVGGSLLLVHGHDAAGSDRTTAEHHDTVVGDSVDAGAGSPLPTASPSARRHGPKHHAPPAQAAHDHATSASEARPSTRRSTQPDPGPRRTASNPAASTKVGSVPRISPPTHTSDRGGDPHQHATTTVVRATRVLRPGQSWSATLARMTLRSDGDLVIQDERGRVRWSAHTRGSGNRVVFQEDGHLVVYGSSNQTLWSSGTAGHNGAQLVLQADGNVVISHNTTVLWAAGTAH